MLTTWVRTRQRTQSLNRYAYVLNNPTTLTDPLGLQARFCPPYTKSLGNGQCVGFQGPGSGNDRGTPFDTVYPTSCTFTVEGVKCWQTIDWDAALDWTKWNTTRFVPSTMIGPQPNQTKIGPQPPPKKPSCFEYRVKELAGGTVTGLASFLSRDKVVEKTAAVASKTMYEDGFRAAVDKAAPGLEITPRQFAFAGRALKWAGPVFLAITDAEIARADYEAANARINGDCEAPSWWHK